MKKKYRDSFRMKNKELNNKNFLKPFEKEFFKFFLLKSQKFKKKNVS